MQYEDPNIYSAEAVEWKRVFRTGGPIVGAVLLLMVIQFFRLYVLSPAENTGTAPLLLGNRVLTASTETAKGPLSSAFDGKTRYFWEAVGPFPHWVQVDFGKDTPPRVTGYRLATGGDGPNGEDSTERMPVQFRLMGSNDGEAWIELDLRQNEPPWQPYQSRIYTVAFPEPYRWIRLVVDATLNKRVLRLYVVEMLTQ